MSAEKEKYHHPVALSIDVGGLTSGHIELIFENARYASETLRSPMLTDLFNETSNPLYFALALDEFPQ